MESSLARVIETEVDLASGIVVERVRPVPPRRRGARAVVLVVVLAGLLSGLAALLVSTGRGSTPQILGTGVQVAALRSDAAPPSLDAYRGAGVWARAGDLTPEAVAGVAARGVRTLFVEVPDPAPSGGVPDPGVTGRLLMAGHRHGLRVFAWYGPAGRDADFDLARLAAIASDVSGGERFDGVAVELTATDPAPQESEEDLYE